MRHHDQPGCVVAIAHKERIVLEEAFGRADLAKDSPVTPRHRFRAASHTKSFTAAAIMKLREQGRLKLDARLVRDRRGRIVEVWLGGSRYRAEAAVAKIMNTRYRKR